VNYFSVVVEFFLKQPNNFSCFKVQQQQQQLFLNKSQTNRLLALPHRPPPILPSPDWGSLLGLQVKLAPSISFYYFPFYYFKPTNKKYYSKEKQNNTNAFGLIFLLTYLFLFLLI
jgi:hypothetical protein